MQLAVVLRNDKGRYPVALAHQKHIEDFGHGKLTSSNEN